MYQSSVTKTIQSQSIFKKIEHPKKASSKIVDITPKSFSINLQFHFQHNYMNLGSCTNFSTTAITFRDLNLSPTSEISFMGFL